jgi:aubergine-like protein
VRSVINKILIQICAKVGGEPWAIDKLPFTKCPTMLVGIDAYNKGNKTIVGLCASYNPTFTKYISIPKIVDQGQNLGPSIKDALQEAISQFQKLNNVVPSHVILLRDGLSFLKMTENEIKCLKEIPNLMLTYVLINKKTPIKVFASDGNSTFKNIPPGTLVDNVVVQENMFDFYLISQKSNQGLSAASHYHVLFDDMKISAEEIQNLIYKSCYLYYNWTGSIKVPAPCQYAKKLAFLVGDKISSKNEFKLPNDRFVKEIRSLYFL